jgi:hypothetical protein
MNPLSLILIITAALAAGLIGWRVWRRDQALRQRRCGQAMI